MNTSRDENTRIVTFDDIGGFDLVFPLRRGRCRRNFMLKERKRLLRKKLKNLSFSQCKRM